MILFLVFIVSSNFIPNLYLSIKFYSEFPLNGIFFTGLYFMPSLSLNTRHTNAFFKSRLCFSFIRCFTYEDFVNIFFLLSIFCVSTQIFVLHSSFASTFYRSSWMKSSFLLAFLTKLQIIGAFTLIAMAT